MAFANRTCVNCGWKGPQPEMVQRERRVEVARGRGTLSGATIIGALAGHKASSRKVGNAVFNTGQRTYTRKVKSWFCADCGGKLPAGKSGGSASETLKILAGGVFLMFMVVSGAFDRSDEKDLSHAEGVAPNEVTLVSEMPKNEEGEDFDRPVLLASDKNNGPSFDCADAEHASELAICGSRELAGLDLALAESFNMALLALPDEIARDLGRGLLRKRKLCMTDADCLRSELTRARQQFDEFARFDVIDMRSSFLARPEGERASIQAYLATEKQYSGIIDGLWGPGTAQAIYLHLIQVFSALGTLDIYADSEDFLAKLLKKNNL
jgi:uncharacterized protein